MHKKIIITIMLAVAYAGVEAQDSMRIFINTGLSVTKVTGQLGRVLKSSIDFSSGIEVVLPGNWFAQGTLDMSRLKYHQQVEDQKSPFLFQNTTADLLLLGLNGGKHVDLTKAFSISGYMGGGYLSLKEPRLILEGNIASQEDVYRRSVFGRIGTKLSLQTKFKFLQTVYVDGNWWATPITIQRAPLQGLSFVISAKMQM